MHPAKIRRRQQAWGTHASTTAVDLWMNLAFVLLVSIVTVVESELPISIGAPKEQEALTDEPPPALFVNISQSGSMVLRRGGYDGDQLSSEAQLRAFVDEAQGREIAIVAPANLKSAALAQAMNKLQEVGAIALSFGISEGEIQ